MTLLLTPRPDNHATARIDSAGPGGVPDGLGEGAPPGVTDAGHFGGHGRFVCGPTAARLHGLPLPPDLEAASMVHVGVSAGRRAPHNSAVTGHSLTLSDGDVVRSGSLLVTTPTRTWCDLAAFLALPDLIAAGDRLVHWHRGWATADAVAGAVARFPSRRGVRALRSALLELDNHVESRAESLLRWRLSHVGLGRFLPHRPIVDSAGRSIATPTLHSLESKVLIHFSDPDDPASPGWRQLVLGGWTAVQVTAEHQDDPDAIVAVVMAELRARRWR